MRVKVSLLLTLILFISAFNQVQAQKLKKKHVKKLLADSEIMQEHFVGFLLQDASGKTIYSQLEDKYFVPASNTKLITLYTAMQMLGDSIPGLYYEVQGDSLIFWGTGDPSFLHPKLDNGRVYEFLTTSPHQLFWGASPSLEYEPSYWSADPAYFPIYGNIALAKSDGLGGLQLFPNGISRFLIPDSTLTKNRFDIIRSKLDDGLRYPAFLAIPESLDDRVPFPANRIILNSLLQDTLKREVTLISKPKPEKIKVLYSIPRDSLLTHMMVPSDNFLAEQILLLCSGTLGDTLSVAHTIAHSQENYLKDLPDRIVWVDGSGLSRFNLFTPRAVMEILTRLEDEVGDFEKLKSFLPAGGVSGTLKNAYQTDNGEPFVWAKTGTLRYMHLQSGWVQTRKGAVYRYVFMNNNFIRPTREITQEMSRIMTMIHERY